jgi:hypothetical protein
MIPGSRWREARMRRLGRGDKQALVLLEEEGVATIAPSNGMWDGEGRKGKDNNSTTQHYCRCQKACLRFAAEGVIEKPSPLLFSAPKKNMFRLSNFV